MSSEYILKIHFSFFRLFSNDIKKMQSFDNTNKDVSHFIYTLRQKFSIIPFQKGSRNVWLKRITVIQNFDAIVPIRYHGNKGSNSDLFWFKIGSY